MINKYLALIVVTFLTSFAIAKDCVSTKQQVPNFIPKQICFNELELDTIDHVLLARGSNINTPDRLPISKLDRINEDKYRFTAQAPFYNQWNSGCEGGERATLSISGFADLFGTTYQNKVSVIYEMTVDTCHSQVQKFVIEYQ